MNSRPGMWFNVDGELVGNEPAAFEVLPRALQFSRRPHHESKKSLISDRLAACSARSLRQRQAAGWC